MEPVGLGNDAGVEADLVKDAALLHGWPVAQDWQPHVSPHCTVAISLKVLTAMATSSGILAGEHVSDVAAYLVAAFGNTAEVYDPEGLPPAWTRAEEQVTVCFGILPGSTASTSALSPGEVNQAGLPTARVFYGFGISGNQKMRLRAARLSLAVAYAADRGEDTSVKRPGVVQACLIMNEARIQHLKQLLEARVEQALPHHTFTLLGTADRGGMPLDTGEPVLVSSAWHDLAQQEPWEPVWPTTPREPAVLGQMGRLWDSKVAKAGAQARSSSNPATKAPQAPWRTAKAGRSDGPAQPVPKHAAMAAGAAGAEARAIAAGARARAAAAPPSKEEAMVRPSAGFILRSKSAVVEAYKAGHDASCSLCKCSLFSEGVLSSSVRAPPEDKIDESDPQGGKVTDYESKALPDTIWVGDAENNELNQAIPSLTALVVRSCGYCLFCPSCAVLINSHLQEDFWKSSWCLVFDQSTIEAAAAAKQRRGRTFNCVTEGQAGDPVSRSPPRRKGDSAPKFSSSAGEVPLVLKVSAREEVSVSRA